MTKVCEGMLIDVKDLDDGYEVWMENTTEDLFDCTLNFSKSENLALDLLDSDAKETEEMVVAFQSKPGSKVAYVKLPVKDMSLGSCKFHYKFKGGKNKDALLAKKKAAEDAEAAKGDEDAAKNEEIKKVLKALEDEEAIPRNKIKIMENGNWVLLARKWRESVCHACKNNKGKGVIAAGAEVHIHKKVLYLHKECYDDLPRCGQCMGLIVGEFVRAKGPYGEHELHQECVTEYKSGVRPACDKCSEKIMENEWKVIDDKPFCKKCAP